MNSTVSLRPYSGEMLNVRMLGPMDVQGHGPIEFPTRKTAMLFAILAFNLGTPMRRESVRNFLWSERGEAQSSGSLRRALSDIRRTFEMHGVDNALRTSATELELDAQYVSLDVHAFVDLAKEDNEAAYSQAALAYRGDLLCDAGATDPNFDDWLRIERRSLRNIAARLVEKLSETAVSESGFDAAENLALQLLRTDEACEEAHRAIIRGFIRRGRHNAALKQYASCVDAVREQLGAEPEDETKELFSEARKHTRVRHETSRSNMLPSRLAAMINFDRTESAPKPKIAVLPFETLTTDSNQDFIGTGLAEDLIIEFSKVEDYDVISQQSSLYEPAGNHLLEESVYNEISYVILGSVRRSENRVRVTVRLVEPSSGQQIWADRLDRDIGDVFILQDEIASTLFATIDSQIRSRQSQDMKRQQFGRPDAKHVLSRGVHQI
ncbi:MAG: hypothetical protein GKS00_14095 [Alphaproteobacteria bacterium]|nr:hypothetical protein [Alphaproteobacteria bacterium]